MSDTLKKIFLIGLGATVAGKEKASKVLNGLSENGNAAVDEMKDYLSRLGEKGSAKKGEWEDNFKSEARDALEDLGFVTVEQYDELKDRIAVLEKQAQQSADESKDKGAATE
ncbi:MAG: hypothetical protein LKI94_08695 [Sporolactobacillus sp.]|jgi:polyhydroxyalkanoate synthesis regulator phasin|nr:hypothetical protein [Sporolactobacillus sp.]MCI1882253.1 hypothetical protein [Sporolactobacillus sp.]